MSHSTSMTSLDNSSNEQYSRILDPYFELRQIYDKKFKEIPKLAKDNIYND